MIFVFLAFLVISIALVANCDEVDHNDIWAYSIISVTSICATIWFGIASLH